MTVEEAEKEYGRQLYEFEKDHPNDTIFWTSPVDAVGINLFSFDKKNVYNLFADFPFKLTDEEVRIFCKENPFWADFFKPRLEERGITL